MTTDSAVLHALQARISQLEAENNELRELVYKGAAEVLQRKLTEAQRDITQLTKERDDLRTNQVLAFEGSLK